MNRASDADFNMEELEDSLGQLNEFVEEEYDHNK